MLRGPRLLTTVDYDLQDTPYGVQIQSVQNARGRTTSRWILQFGGMAHGHMFRDGMEPGGLYRPSNLLTGALEYVRSPVKALGR